MHNNGTFVIISTYSTGAHSIPYSLTVNYFNDDKYLDIAVANYGTHNIGVYLGYGNGAFADPNMFTTDSSRPLFITSGDLNNDNHSDIVVANVKKLTSSLMTLLYIQ